MADDGLKEGAQHQPYKKGSGKSGSQYTPQPADVKGNPRTGTDQFTPTIQVSKGKTVSTKGSK